jgi:hypothetical protein
METSSTPPPIASGSVNLSAPPPVAAPTTNMVSTPVMESGGQTSSSDASFFKSINWLEVGFMILGSAALLYTIYYYKVQMEKTKLANNRLSKQIDEVKMNLQSQMKGKYKEIV